MPEFGKPSAIFSVSGRLARGAYLRKWLRIQVVVAVALIAVVILADTGHRTIAIGLAYLVGAGYFAALTATAIRRLHDRNRSGWWFSLVLGLMPLTYALGDRRAVQSGYLLLFSLLAVVANFWIQSELLFRRGTVGRNRFGPDPLGDAKPDRTNDGPPPLPPTDPQEGSASLDIAVRSHALETGRR